LIRSRELVAVKFGSRMVVTDEDLRRFIEKHRTEAAVILLNRLIQSTLLHCDIDTIPGKVRFVEKVSKHVVRLSDPEKREHYIQRVARIVQLPVNVVLQRFPRDSQRGATG
jgi:hypothetical protein